MAGILEQLRKPRKQLVGYNAAMPGTNPKSLELKAAKEILAEVFDINVSEVDEILKERCLESLERPKASHRKRIQREPLLKHLCNEEWPQEFCLIES